MDTLHHYLFHGNLRQGGSWGGAVCAAYLPFQELIYESFAWTVGSLFFVNAFNSLGVVAHLHGSVDVARVLSRRPFWQFMLDKLLGSLLLTIFLFLCYYKYNAFALCTLLQPCHLILLTQGAALVCDGGMTVVLSLMQLPLMSHTLALAFPDTTGLDQPMEADMYWYQHYLTAVVPLYLLMRHDFQALDRLMANFWTVWSAFLAFVVLAHFGFYSSFDFIFKVNVQFMLCPGDGMRGALEAAPQWLMWPTYRSVLLLLTAAISLLLTFVLVSAAQGLRRLLGCRPPKDMNRTTRRRKKKDA